MIYLFAGDDADKKIKSYEKFLDSLKGLEVFKISRSNFSPVEIESFYSGAGLFFTRCVVVFSNILEREEERAFVLDKLNEFNDSPNTFVFIEGKLTKPVLDAFKKLNPVNAGRGAELNIFELPKEKHEKFNNFLLANALGDRDKLSLWLNYRQAVDLGVGLEELVGVMFWKVKDMILKKNFYKFKKEELQSIANKLSFLLPEARRMGVDDEVALEQFILEIF